MTVLVLPQCWQNGVMTRQEKTSDSFHIGAGSAETAVEHQPDRHSFIITVAGARAGHADYVDHGEWWDFNHTVIDQAFRGQGLSAPLIGAALDQADAAGKRVAASCSAVAHFIESNPRYGEMLVDRT